MTQKKLRVKVSKSLTRKFNFITRQRIAKKLVSTFYSPEVSMLSLDDLSLARIPFEIESDSVIIYGVRFKKNTNTYFLDDEKNIDYVVDMFNYNSK